jgi:hypothetical protein
MLIRVLYLVLCLLLSGCGLKEYPNSHQLKDFLKFEKQPDDITCGPTCASMVVSYYGKNVNCSDLESYVLSKATLAGRRFGFSLPAGISKGLRHYDVKNRILRGNINELKWHVSNNKPTIVLLRSANDLWHYVVVIGYTQNDICIADPDNGKKEWMLKDVFLRSWSFKSDMEGNPVGNLCWLCKGSGSFLYLPCDVCLGSGYMDGYRSAILSAGIYSYTMIVPNSGK